MTILSSFEVADISVRYQHDPETGAVGLELFPTALADQLAARRQNLLDEPEIDAMPGIPRDKAFHLDPLAHVKIVGDSYPGAFAQGHTMRDSASNWSFRFEDQQVQTSGDQTTVVTFLAGKDGLRIEHRLSWYQGDAAIQVETVFHNGSSHPVTLEMLTSFSLGGLSPFHRADAPERLRVHRFRSVWACEGRLDTRTMEELHLERSATGAGLYSERFGQIGSMPVRKWFPFVAVEDTEAHVTWGAQLAWAGSWQMEISRQHDPVCISGGLADREFGHWTKTLATGESITAPPATLSCVHGNVDDLCDRLTAVQHRAADTHPEIEHDLPIVFNEWCTTWGHPTHDRLLNIARRLKHSKSKYLVIDAGWYKTDNSDWGDGHGDWEPSSVLFPDGLEATAAAIRAEGKIPGLWFEMETVGDASVAFSLVDHLLKRDGIPVTVRHRRFWNLNDPFAVDYLTEKVINLLDRCGFGYLKVDYNETVGFGVEGAESLGEGLRRQTIASQKFFERIRQRLPHLVIENCASGGHRLEPSMLARSAMSSFSDAHETVEIPIIAASLHRLMLPRQSQIWAVLHASDSRTRLAYSLAATFLGRMCLSGEVDDLSEEQWKLVRDAEDFYAAAAPVIKYGTSRIFEFRNESWRYPTGWQASIRTAADKNSVLVVLHSFANAPGGVEVPLPEGTWQITEAFGASDGGVRITGNHLDVAIESDFSGRGILLSRVG
jgi:alpha-galactosidase